ncbi:ubiquinol-cytochrome c reductase core subunit 1 [Rhodosporidiobolus nylandii]
MRHAFQFLLVAPALCLAAPLLPRQGLANDLSIYWGDAGSVYLSTADYTCGPYPIVLAALYPPVSIEAIAFPFPPSGAEENATIFVPLGAEFEAGQLSWLPTQLDERQRVVLRATDGEGEVAYTAEKEVKMGGKGKWMCRATASGKRKERKDILITLLSCFMSLLFALVGIPIALYLAHRRSHHTPLEPGEVVGAVKMDDEGEGREEKGGSSAAAERARRATRCWWCVLTVFVVHDSDTPTKDALDALRARLEEVGDGEEGGLVGTARRSFAPGQGGEGRLRTMVAALRTAALRANARVATPALARGYATPSSVFAVQDVNGVKVASVDEGAPTAAISVVVKAGSRYEPAPGVAHVLKNSLFKANNKRSQIRLVRETEALGGVLSTSLSREHLVLTAEFLKGDEAFFAEALGDAITQAKLPLYEYNEEVVPQVAGEYEQAVRNSSVYAFDLAHQLAFRKGLGNSLFASPHTAVDHSTAVSFAKSSFAPSNLAVFGSNVDAGKLKSLVSDFFVSGSPSSSSISTPASKYFGGEVRVPSVGHSEVDQLLIAFQGAASTEVEFAVLRALLGGETYVKWGAGASPLAKLATATSSAKAFNLAYSDAGLFGISVSAKTADVADVAQKAVAALKEVANGASEEAVKQAIAKAKFAAASALETRAGQVEIVGHSVAANGAAPSLEEVFAKLDKVSAESLAKAAKSALSSKPTTVAVGNTHALPYADALL